MREDPAREDPIRWCGFIQVSAEFAEWRDIRPIHIAVRRADQLCMWFSRYGAEEKTVAHRTASRLAVCEVGGPPCVGKTALCARLAAAFNVEHIAVGPVLEKLRAENPPSDLANEARGQTCRVSG